MNTNKNSPRLLKNIKYRKYSIRAFDSDSGIYANIYCNRRYLDCSEYRNDVESAIESAKQIIDYNENAIRETLFGLGYVKNS